MLAGSATAVVPARDVELEVAGRGQRTSRCALAVPISVGPGWVPGLLAGVLVLVLVLVSTLRAECRIDTYAAF